MYVPRHAHTDEAFIVGAGEVGAFGRALVSAVMMMLPW
jgi:hypothetical protein